MTPVKLIGAVVAILSAMVYLSGLWFWIFWASAHVIFAVIFFKYTSNNVHVKSGAAAVVAVEVLGTAYISGWLSWIMWLAAHLLIALLGFYYAAQWNLVCGKNYKPVLKQKKKNIINIIVQKMLMLDTLQKDQPRKVVISRSLDNAIQEVLDLIAQNSIQPWYQPLTSDLTFVKHAQTEMWHVVDQLSRRLSEVDLVRLLSQDVLDCLHRHFECIRLAKRDPHPEKATNPDSKPVMFWLHPWLRDDESELDCLRKITDALLVCLLSPVYARCDPVRHLLREIIAATVLKPTIEMVCDPDYINLKLLDYMAYREKLFADSKRTFMYSATYEGFVKMIKMSDSVSDLRQMRYNIISEILQASAINNLKKQQGINTEKDVAPKNTNKGELLKARNLERYKRQLTVAKQLCEKRLVSLGEKIYESEANTSTCKDEIRGQKVFSFVVIMEMPQGREFFMKYLKKEGADSYMGFWNGVEKLKSSTKEKRHHLASELYQQYIVSASSLVKVDKSVLKTIEDFLRGNTQLPDAFYTAQKDVEKVLDDQFYPSFIVSDTYHQLEALLREGVISDDGSCASNELFLDSDDIKEEEGPIAGQSYLAQKQLRALDQKIDNKLRALKAQRSSQKMSGNVKLQKVHEDMERELEFLRQERITLEGHIYRTQKWIDHTGQWTVNVYDAKVIVEDDKKVAQFVLLVSYCHDSEPDHVLAGSIPDENVGSDERSAEVYGSPPEPVVDGVRDSQKPRDKDVSDSAKQVDDVGGSTQGWAIERKLEDFYALHEKLSQMSSTLQKKELPSSSIFKTIDDAFVQKARVSLDEYLAAVLSDDRVLPSETLYAFLSPTPEFVYQNTSLEKKSKFSLASLIKSLPLPNIRTETQDHEEDFMFGADDGVREERSPDSIAKPLYRLVDEVFELQGVFRWFRRGLINFVELTFGRSIDRQLKATVDWLVSEQMLIYYTQMFKESVWPEVVETPQECGERSDSVQQLDRLRAKAKLLENMPDELKSLVGEDNARRGVIKLFEVLQNRNLNKHLLYNLLELFLMEILPEMKTAQLKRISKQENNK